MQPKSNSDLFWRQIKGTYYTDQPALTLPQDLAWCALQKRSPVLDTCRGQTDDHIARLQQVFESLGDPAPHQSCPAIEGFIEQSEKVLNNYTGATARDAGLAAIAQAVEQYEIARHGTLRPWAELLGLAESLALLKKTFAEKSAADQPLGGAMTKVAVNDM